MAFLRTSSVSMAIVLLAIDRIIGVDRDRSIVPGEAAYCAVAWFPGRHRSHTYEHHFKRLRDKGVLEHRVDKKGRFLKRPPDPSVAKLPEGVRIRNQDAMEHWWTKVGWVRNWSLINQARAVLESEGIDLGFLSRER